MVVRVWNELEKEKMMARLRKGRVEEESTPCPTLEALPSGWRRINVRKMNGIRAKFYITPSGLRFIDILEQPELLCLGVADVGCNFFFVTGLRFWRLL